jgi:hypothetical protein
MRRLGRGTQINGKAARTGPGCDPPEFRNLVSPRRLLVGRTPKKKPLWSRSQSVLLDLPAANQCAEVSQSIA